MKNLPQPNPNRKVAIIRLLREALTELEDTEEQPSSGSDTDRWVDPVAASGLPKRLVFDACRSGEIRGARKIGKFWRVRRRDLDAWMDSHAPAPANDQGDGRPRAKDYLAKWSAEDSKPRRSRRAGGSK